MKRPFNQLDLPDETSSTQDETGAWRLGNYLRFGALNRSGGISKRILQERRQERFLIFAAVFFALWLVALIV